MDDIDCLICFLLLIGGVGLGGLIVGIALDFGPVRSVDVSAMGKAVCAGHGLSFDRFVFEDDHKYPTLYCRKAVVNLDDSVVVLG